MVVNMERTWVFEAFEKSMEPIEDSSAVLVSLIWDTSLSICALALAVSCGGTGGVAGVVSLVVAALAQQTHKNVVKGTQSKQKKKLGNNYCK